ncbi:MAG: BACON domain-containing protein [Prevotella sp.]|nr:BACON domain-containing protein [Prevotella sp.]
MKLKKNFLPLLLGGFLLFVSSCAKEDEFELPTLVLSESSIVFDKGFNERNITVNTNQDKWTASSPHEGDWVAIVQDGNVLKIRASENKMGTERTSHVIVNANGATGKIEMRQSAADILLEVMPEAIYLPQSGGEKIIDITTNASKYDVTTSEEVDWLRIYQFDEEIKLVAEKNITDDVRNVKLYAKSGDKTREITVSQSGLQRYILPVNPGFPQDVHKIMEYELGRGSYMRDYQAAYPAFGLEETYTFVTPSPIFTLMQYCSPDGITSSQIITIGDGMQAVKAVKDKAFEKFLINNGYVRSNSESDREYLNETDLLALKVYVSEKPESQGVNLTFTPVLKQPGEYKTFDKLPFYPLELLQKPDVKFAEVEKYEQKAGSREEERTMNEHNPTEVAQIQYVLNGSETQAYGRIHIFFTTDAEGKADPNLGSVQIGALLFKNTDLGLWKYGSKWIVTNELKKKMSEEGFSYVRTANNTHFFARERDHLFIAVTGVVDNNQPVLAMLYNYDTTAVGAGSKAIEAQEKLVKKFKAAERLLKF